MDYYQKYLKYRTKYINLQYNQIGSGFTNKKSQIKLVKLVRKRFWEIYDGNIKSNNEKRVLSIEVMYELIRYCMKYEKEAFKYVSDRDKKSKKKMNKIQKDVLAEVKSIIPKDWEITPSSSFSANIYLMNDSDIDFTILINNMDKNIQLKDIEVMMNKNGYYFREEKSKGNKDHYYVFEPQDGTGKMIKKDDIEIELKFRDKEAAKRIMAIHQYIDRKDTELDHFKPYITYLKYILKGTPSYSLLKYIISECALALSGWSGELFGNQVTIKSMS